MNEDEKIENKREVRGRGRKKKTLRKSELK